MKHLLTMRRFNRGTSAYFWSDRWNLCTRIEQFFFANKGWQRQIWIYFSPTENVLSCHLKYVASLKIRSVVVEDTRFSSMIEIAGNFFMLWCLKFDCKIWSKRADKMSQIKAGKKSSDRLTSLCGQIHRIKKLSAISIIEENLRYVLFSHFPIKGLSILQILWTHLWHT